MDSHDPLLRSWLFSVFVHYQIFSILLVIADYPKFCWLLLVLLLQTSPISLGFLGVAYLPRVAICCFHRVPNHPQLGGSPSSRNSWLAPRSSSEFLGLQQTAAFVVVFAFPRGRHGISRGQNGGRFVHVMSCACIIKQYEM